MGDEWEGLCTHPHAGDESGQYDESIFQSKPSDLLNQISRKLSSTVDLRELLSCPASEDLNKRLPGELRLAATAKDGDVMSLQAVLEIGSAEAQLLFEATDKDEFEAADFEEDREPKMRDLAVVTRGLERVESAVGGSPMAAGPKSSIPVRFPLPFFALPRP